MLQTDVSLVWSFHTMKGTFHTNQKLKNSKKTKNKLTSDSEMIQLCYSGYYPFSDKKEY